MQRLIIGFASVVVVAGSAWVAVEQPAAETSSTLSPGRRHWVKITFGLDGEAADWDGHLTLEKGDVLSLQSWGFEREHTLDVARRKWQCSSAVNRRRELASYAEPYRGLLLEMRSTSDTLLHVDTVQGDFEVLISQLQAGHPAAQLNDRASVELTGDVRPLVGEKGWRVGLKEVSGHNDDFPTLAVDDEGRRWVAWITYDEDNSRDLLKVLNLDDPQATTQRIDAAARLLMKPVLLNEPGGGLWLFWTQPHQNNWDIFACRRRRGRWSPPERITTGPRADFELVAATAPDGALWLAWQSFRHGNSDIFAKRYAAGKWSDDVAVTGHASNQWHPSISVDPRGRAWIALDSYENGNYDVLLTSLTLNDQGQPQVGETSAIAASKDFEAHPSVEATGEAVWIAYDAAGPNWGKDLASYRTTYQGTYADALHANRRVQLRCYVDRRVYESQPQVPQQLDTFRPQSLAHRYQGEVRRFYELPQLARDPDGRLWVFFRLNRQGYAEDPEAALWEVFATTFADGRWLQPILLPESWGRQNQQLATANVRGAANRKVPPGMYCAWSRGHHMNDMRQRLRVGKLPLVDAAVAERQRREIVIADSSSASEPEIRSWVVRQHGKSYHVYFGDMHRHTDISWCYPTVDGSPVDAMRYALDAARLDFLAITDHSRDTDPYPWWYTQKINDVFNVPNRFTTVYGYERSNSTPGGGHRNVFFVERDWPVFRSEAHYKHFPDASPGRLDPPAALYPHLRGKNALTAAHTPAYSRRDQRGTWSYNDPEVEPLVEIFQGFRRSYERPTAGVMEEASIWYALQQGFRLGFIASSDHVSTHVSYACLWAEDNTRESLFEAMRARRTYAATDKIIMDVRLGGALMGEETMTAGKPELTVRVRGTAPIDELQVIRNAEVIWEASPGERQLQTTFTDRQYDRGPAWYYVRVKQVDDAMAWSSPIWVNSEP